MKNITREEARKGFLEVEFINKTIKSYAEAFGFSVRESRVTTGGVVDIIATNLICFTKVDYEFAIYDDFVQEIYSVSFEAQVSRLGGERTPEELREVAKEIINMATLVEQLNGLEMKFVKILDR